MKLVIDAKALKVLLGMPKDDAAALRAKLKTFAADPYGHPAWAKAIGGGCGRIRQDNWRALYTIQGDDQDRPGLEPVAGVAGPSAAPQP